MLITPDTYATRPVEELLGAAARGLVGLDLRWARAILSRGEEAAEALVRFGMEEQRDDAVDLTLDVILLLRELQSPKALPLFVDVVRRFPSDVPDELVLALHEQGVAAIEPLLKLCDETDEDEAEDIAFVLASTRLRDPRVLKLLLERLEFSASEGAFLLGVYGDPAARPALERLLGQVPDDGDAGNALLRFELQDALGQIGGASAASAPEPFELAEYYPEEAPPVFDVLHDAERLEFLEAPVAEYRAQVAASFFNEELTVETVAALRRTAESDSESAVRAEAWRALMGAADDPGVRQALLDCVNNGNAPAPERAAALVALSLDEDPGLRSRMKEFYEAPQVRARAMEAMWRSLDRDFAPYFPKHLNDADPDVRRQALLGTGYLGLHAETDRLRAMFDEEEFRSEALFAYALSVRAEISRGRVKALLRKIDEQAGGLSLSENEVVQQALDDRLMLHGLDPVFSEDGDAEDEPEDAPPPPPPAKPGRNDPCPCGSGKKYKKCCGA